MRLFSLFLIFLVTHSHSIAGTGIVAEYTFSGDIGTGFNRASSDTDDQTQASILIDGRTNFATGSATGNPAPSYAVITNRLAATESATLSANNYGSFTVTAEPGRVLNPSLLQFELMDSASDVRGTWFVRSSVDNFQSNIGVFSGTTVFKPESIDLSAAQYQGHAQLTFRFYPYSVRRDSSSSVRLDNIRLEAATAPDFTRQGDFPAGPPVELAPITSQFMRHSEGAAVELPDGTLLLAWSRFYLKSGMTSGGGDNDPANIVLSRSLDRGETWSEPEPLGLPEGTINNMQVSFLQLGDTTQLYYSKRMSQTSSDKWLIESTDGGLTWTAPRQLTDGARRYTGPNDRMVRLSNGRILLPCHTIANMAPAGNDLAPIIAWSDDDGLTWDVGSPVMADAQYYNLSRPLRMHEPALVERMDGSVWMLARTTNGRLFESVSTDGGETWSTAQPTGILSLTAPPQLKRLSDGRLALFWNPYTEETWDFINRGQVVPEFQRRTFLAMATSSDDGLNWSEPVIIADGGTDSAYAYPAILETEEGLLVFASKSPFLIDPSSLVQIRVLLNQDLPRASKGTPLAWLQEQFGTVENWDAVESSSPSGNGQPAWVSFRAGLDPWDPLALFQIVETIPGEHGLTLRWRGSNASGATSPFHIQTSTTLAADDWHFRAAVERTSNPVQEWTEPEVTEGPRRFYRVVVPD